MNRREFLAFAGISILKSGSNVYETRVYGPGSVLPPVGILERTGISIVRRTRREYTLLFASPEERVKAWDRFNCDLEWCALRERGEVSIAVIEISSRDQPGGRIFEISL